MSDETDIDYGPLKNLIGVWKGDKGIDVAPDPEGVENNPYYENITFTGIGDVTNAESQVLSVVYYRQTVFRKSDDQAFHDETGYWMWDPKTKTVIHSLVIPRAVCVLAGGQYAGATNTDGSVIIEVEASIDDNDWKIIQSPFMRENACTTGFRQKIEVGDEKLSYSETTIVDIYGKVFEHTDENELNLSRE
jgi:hypothetical protein